MACIAPFWKSIIWLNKIKLVKRKRILTKRITKSSTRMRNYYWCHFITFQCSSVCTVNNAIGGERYLSAHSQTRRICWCNAAHCAHCTDWSERFLGTGTRHTRFARQRRQWHFCQRNKYTMIWWTIEIPKNIERMRKSLLFCLYCESASLFKHTEHHRRFHHFCRSVHLIEHHTNFRERISFRQCIARFQHDFPFQMKQSHDRQHSSWFLFCDKNSIN